LCACGENFVCLIVYWLLCDNYEIFVWFLKVLCVFVLNFSVISWNHTKISTQSHKTLLKTTQKFRGFSTQFFVGITQKCSSNTIFHGIKHRNLSFEKILFQKHAKNLIWRGSGSGPNPSTFRHRIKNSAVFQGDT
jgi:hypothetical protein